MKKIVTRDETEKRVLLTAIAAGRFTSSGRLHAVRCFARPSDERRSASDAPAGAAEGSGGGRGAAAGSSSTGDAAGSSSTAIVPATPLRPVSEADKRQSIDDAMSLFGKKRVGVAEEEEAAQKAAEDCISKFVYGVRRGADEEEKLAACMELAKYVNNAFGYEASKLGSHLRFTKGLAFILQLLYEGQAPIQRIGLMVLSNLCSDAFDPLSNLTKKQVLNAQIFERIKDFVYSGDQVAQTYAVAPAESLQGGRLRQAVALLPLTEELELVTVSPPHLRKFAAGALFNAVEAVHKEFVNNSRDTAEGAEAMKKKGLLASFMGAEVEPEIELSEEVLEELAKREASLSEERRQREEAALVIQGLMRQKRTRRAFRMLMALAKAVSLVAMGAPAAEAPMGGAVRAVALPCLRLPQARHLSPQDDPAHHQHHALCALQGDY